MIEYVRKNKYDYDIARIWARLGGVSEMVPSFRAYRDPGSNQIINLATTETLIQLNAEIWDNYGAFNTGTYLWTCPKRGKYQFNAGVRVTNGSGGASDLYFRLRVNGAAGTIFLHPLYELAVPNGIMLFRHGSAQYIFSVGDTVGLYGYVSAQPVTVTVGGVWGVFMDAHFVCS